MINLMNQKNCRWGDKCLDDFLEMFQTNTTLLKINWRLESRKSFALNKMITRNNEIDRRKKCGMDYNNILPSSLQDPNAPLPPAPAPALPYVPAAAPVTPVQSAAGKENHAFAPLETPTPVGYSSTPSEGSHNTSSSDGGVASRWQPKSSPASSAAGGDAVFVRGKRGANSVLNRWPPGGASD